MTNMKQNSKSRRWLLKLLLLIVIVTAAIFRFYQVDWDMPGSPHPDENQVMMQVAKLQLFRNGELYLEGMNPNFFAYGSLPLYMYFFMKEGARLLVKNIPALRNFITTNPYILARILTAFLGWLTLFPVYLLARRLYGRWTAVVALILFAFASLHIKLCHFLTVDVILTFFIMLSIYFAAKILLYGRLRDYIPAAIFFGMAMAVKIAAFPLAVTLVAAHILHLIHIKRVFPLWKWVGFILLPVFAFGAFFVSEPFGILNFKEFFHQVSWQAKMVQGGVTPWYVLHYEDTVKFFYQMKNYLNWAMGWPLGIFTLISFAYFIAASFFSKERLKHLFMLSFTVPFFITVFVLAKVKFIRYQVPAVPLFCIMSAYLLYRFYRKAKTSHGRALTYAFTVFLATSGLFLSMATLAVFNDPSSREMASLWIYENVPEGSTILAQEIEPRLPRGMPGYTPHKYQYREINVIQDPKGDMSLTKFAENIAESDFIVLPNPGHYNLPLSAGPERFPHIFSYYQNLFGGTLGFELVQSFTSYPRLLGFEMNDSLSDIGFYFFDHPKVQIFKKNRSLSVSKLKSLIKSPPPSVASITKKDIMKAEVGSKHLAEMRRRAAESAAEARSARTAKGEEPIPDKGFRYIFLWYITAQIIALLALPITMTIFRSFRDRGYPLAKTIGFFSIAWINFILVSTKFLKYNRASILLSYVILAVLSAFVWSRRKSEIKSFFKSPKAKKIIITTEIVFLLIFALLQAIKCYNPDISGWERPSEFAYYNAVHRSETLPPHDPWIANEPLNYYYYCWHAMMMITKGIGIPTQFAYNIGVAFVAGLTALCIFSLLFNVTKKIRYGLLGALFITFVGNFDSIRQVIKNRRFFPFDWFRAAHSPIEFTISEFPFWSYVYGDLHPHIVVLPVIGAMFLFYYKWIKSSESGLNKFGTGMNRWLSVFVFMMLMGTAFTVHLWELPTQILLLLFILSLQHFRITSQKRLPGYERRPPLFVRLGRYIINVIAPWIGLGIGAVALVYVPFKLGLTKFTELGVGSTLTIVGKIARSYTSPLTQFLIVFGFFMFIALAVLLIKEWDYSKLKGKSIPVRFVKLILLIAVLTGAWALLYYKGEWVGKALAIPLSWLDDQIKDIFLIGPLYHKHVFLGWKVRQWDELTYKINYSMALFLIPFLFSTLRVIFNRNQYPGEQMGLCMMLMAFAVLLGEELVYLRDFLSGGDWRRMNSVFKFHFQSWILLSVSSVMMIYYIRTGFKRLFGSAVPRRFLYILSLLAGAVGVFSWIAKWIDFKVMALIVALPVLFIIVRLIKNIRAYMKGRYKKVRHIFFTELLDAFDAAFVFLLIATLTFAFTGTHQKIKERSNGRGNIPTLNGLDFKWKVNREEYDAIKWINRNIKGTPVILETTGKSYQAFSRISMNTGLPTLLGWMSHVVSKGYTWEEAYKPANAIDKIYDTQDIEEAFRLLKQFNVSYVYVGYLEKQRHEQAGLEKFDEYECLFNKIYENPKVSIYEVRGHGFWETAKSDVEGEMVMLEEDLETEMDLASGNFLVGGKGDLESQFLYPRGMAVDIEGKFYIADTGNSRVQKFDHRGIFEDVWGAQGSGPDEFDHPYDVTVDAEGRIYVADTWNDRISVLNPTGKPLVHWPSADAEYTLSRPGGIAADQRNGILVSDTGNNRVVVLSKEGEVLKTLGKTGEGPGEFRRPVGIAVGRNGVIHVADAGNRRIQLFNAEFEFIREIPFDDGIGGLTEDIYLDVDDAGNIYVSLPGRETFRVFSPEGQSITESLFQDTSYITIDLPTGLHADRKTVYVVNSLENKVEKFRKEEPVNMLVGGEGSKSGQFVQPRDLDVDSEGNVFIVDFRNFRIQKFTKDGRFQGKWGKEGDEPGQFKDPCGIAVDNQDNVFVADTWNHRIQKFDKEGKFIKSWEEGRGHFFAPRGVEVDEQFVYVCDTGGGQIQLFNKDGRFVTAFSSKGSGPDQLSEPCGVAVDQEGKVYVADFGNARIQVFNKMGRGLHRSIPVTEWEGEAHQEPYIDVDNQGRIYVTSPVNKRLIIYSAEGAILKKLGSARRGGSFNHPTGLAVGDDGTVYIMEMYDPKVRILPPSEIW